MTRHASLQMVFVQDIHGAPLAVVDGLPGRCAELTVIELRALARELSRAADDLAACPFHFVRYPKSYVLFPAAQKIAASL